MFVRSALLVVIGLLACGCNELDGFTTPPGEAYCGGITLGSAFRTGFSPRVQMRLTFDAAALDTLTSPGKLTTFDPGEAHPHLLQDAALRPIEPLAHDALSALQFGDGRDRNALFAVTPVLRDEESLLAFVSLRSDDAVEVRLVRAGLPASESPDPGRQPLFGLFTLGRREGDCGF